MRGLVKLTLAAALMPVIGCGTAKPIRSLTHASVLAKAGLSSYWEAQLQLLEDEQIDRMWLREENLYCLTSENALIAVDAARGVRKWAVQVAPTGVKVFPPSHGTNVSMKEQIPDVREVVTLAAPETMGQFDVVFINTPNYALALDRATGQQRRKIDFTRQPDQFVASTGGSCDGTFYYVGGLDGACRAYRVNEDVIAWRMATEDVLSSSPQCRKMGEDWRVFVVGEDGNYYVASAGDLLSRIWPPDESRSWPAMAGPARMEFHVDDRACFVACAKRRVYAFPLGGGAPIWRFTCDGALSDPLQVSENTVFQYARGDKLYAVNPTNGQLRWAMPRGTRVLAAMVEDDAPTAYIVDNADNLLVVDEILGTVRASMPLTGCGVFADNTSAPAIYVGSRTGDLYCLRQIGAAHLTADILKGIKPKPEKAGK